MQGVYIDADVVMQVVMDMGVYGREGLVRRRVIRA